MLSSAVFPFCALTISLRYNHQVFTFRPADYSYMLERQGRLISTGKAQLIGTETVYHWQCAALNQHQLDDASLSSIELSNRPPSILHHPYSKKGINLLRFQITRDVIRRDERILHPLHSFALLTIKGKDSGREISGAAAGNLILNNTWTNFFIKKKFPFVWRIPSLFLIFRWCMA